MPLAPNSFRRVVDRFRGWMSLRLGECDAVQRGVELPVIDAAESLPDLVR
jgi:hypothetical protein